MCLRAHRCICSHIPIETWTSCYIQIHTTYIRSHTRKVFSGVCKKVNEEDSKYPIPMTPSTSIMIRAVSAHCASSCQDEIGHVRFARPTDRLQPPAWLRDVAAT